MVALEIARICRKGTETLINVRFPSFTCIESVHLGSGYFRLYVCHVRP